MKGARPLVDLLFTVLTCSACVSCSWPHFIVWFAGCLCRSSYKVGDIMIMRDQVSLASLSGVHPLIGPNDPRFGTRFPAVSPFYRYPPRPCIHVVARACLVLAVFYLRFTVPPLSGACLSTSMAVQDTARRCADELGIGGFVHRGAYCSISGVL